MPTRNVIKNYGSDAFYHVYTRGVNKQKIFREKEDYLFFISLFKRYLSPTPTRRSKHPPYPNFSGEIVLLSYCLMPNHIHMFVFQKKSPKAIESLMRSIFTSYSSYFNRKYDRVGPLFQSRYLASPIRSQSYLMHISRYIHLNPTDWKSYPYSSLRYFSGSARADWIQPNIVLQHLNTTFTEYTNFLSNYLDYQKDRDSLEFLLAHK